MIKGKTILAIIPARGGSKGVRKKNIRIIGGKPLIAWTIEAARASKYIDKLIVSSDDDEILKFANEWGVETPFVRPDYLSRDDTPAIEVILHAVEQLSVAYDYILLLQPTSPLRANCDIDGILELCIEHNRNSSVSVTEAEQSPYWMYRLDDEQIMKPLIAPTENYYRRQDLPPVYVLNGALYVAKTSWLTHNKKLVMSETIGYVMSKESSIDIDSELDLMLADVLLTKKMNEKRMMGNCDGKI